MQPIRHYQMPEPDEVRRLVRRHPWATIVTAATTGLVASHYPLLLEEEADGIVLLTHFGMVDARMHEAGQHEVLVIVQGPHDYVSSSWYTPGDDVPTWNHLTAHLYGTPELLSDEANFQVLTRLTDHFEHGRPGARSTLDDEATSRRIAKGTVGLRIPVTRFDAKWKLSQNKPAEVQDRIERELGEATPALATEMRRMRGRASERP